MSRIGYVCEVDAAVTRDEGDPKLPEDGLGNKEFNIFHTDWKGYDFAYRVRSVYEILEPISLAKMKSQCGCKGAPRGLIYLPAGIAKDVPWKLQKCRIPRADAESPEIAGPIGGKRAAPVDGGGEEAGTSELRPQKARTVQFLSSPKY